MQMTESFFQMLLYNYKMKIQSDRMLNVLLDVEHGLLRDKSDLKIKIL